MKKFKKFMVWSNEKNVADELSRLGIIHMVGWNKFKGEKGLSRLPQIQIMKKNDPVVLYLSEKGEYICKESGLKLELIIENSDSKS